MLTQLNPGTLAQIRQVHNKAQAIDGKLYYGRDDDGLMHTYRGTHEGRLKEETNLLVAESGIIVNEEGVSDNRDAIEDLVTEDIRLETVKADKCYVSAMSIMLG